MLTARHPFASDPSLMARAKVHAALADPHRLAIVESLWGTDRSPSELGAAFGIESNLLAHHLRTLEASGVVRTVVSAGDKRRRYLQVVPAALQGLSPPAPTLADRVLFVCTRNSARSQLAAALFANITGKRAASAGTHPVERINPLAVKTARRHGLDLSGVTPRSLQDAPFSPEVMITVCDQANEEMLLHGIRRLHWSVRDPVPLGTDEAFEQAFAAIENRIMMLVVGASPA